MKQLTCEMCGSNDLLKQDGVFVCQTCGTKYSVEEAKKMMIEGTVEVQGTVKIDSSASKDNYLDMANSAYQSGNKAEAEMYANKVIEIDPTNYQAWLLKGQAAGWQSTLANLRFSESVTAFTKAISFAPEDKKSDIREIVGEEIQNLSCSLISLRAERFIKWPDEEETAGFQADLTAIIQTIKAISNGGDIVPVAETFGALAEIISDSVNTAYKKKIYPDYKSNQYPYPTDNDFSKYIARISNSINVLTTAVSICLENKETAIKIYNQMIDLQERAKESCSYDWETVHANLRDSTYADMYRQKGYIVDASRNRVYFVNKTLTDEAKRNRTISVMKYRNEVNRLTAEIANEKKEKQDKQRNAFWEEHASEYQILTKELEKSQSEITYLTKDNQGYMRVELLEEHVHDIKKILEADRARAQQLSTSEENFINGIDDFWKSVAYCSEYDAYLNQYPILKQAKALQKQREELLATKQEIMQKKANAKPDALLPTSLTAVLGIFILLIGFSLGVFCVVLGALFTCVGGIAATVYGTQYMKALSAVRNKEDDYKKDVREYNATIDKMHAVPKYSGNVNHNAEVKIPMKIDEN